MMNRRCLKSLAIAIALSATSTAAYAQSSTITSNFNNTNVPAGRYIWFNAALNPSGTYANGTILQFSNSSIFIDASSGPLTLNVPNSTIYFDNTTTPYTTYNPSTGWETHVNYLSGQNVFLGALAYQVPAGVTVAGSNPVSWTATFATNNPPLDLQWQWAAAVYTTFSNDYNALLVKASDGAYGPSGGPYDNSNNVGTPEAYKTYVVGGARGGGGSNYTGSYSGTASLRVTNELSTVPEPTSMTLLASGLVGIFGAAKRRRRNRA